VDTVKQAEIFVAIRGRYDIPKDESLKLRDFPTLNHVVGFVMDRAPGGTAVSAIPAEPVAIQPEPAPASVTVAVPEVVAATAAGALDENEVREVVMELVAEQTGYPTDMLDPELDLEADLGVDTVKQAEIFVAIRGRYDIPKDESLKLRDFPTLNHVVGFVLDRAPGGAPAASPPIEPEPLVAEPKAVNEVQEPAIAEPLLVEAPVAAAAALDEDEVRQVVMELVAEQTGYPTDMLDPELDLEADLGVDTVKQAEIFVAIRGRYDIPKDESLKLRDFPTLNHVVGFVMDRTPKGATLAVATTEPAEEPQDVAPIAEHLFDGIDGANGVPRRVAVPVLRPALDACVPTGVEIGAGSRIAVMADGGGVAKELTRLLEERGADVFVIDERPEQAELEATLAAWLAGGPATGLYWLPALDRDEDAERFEPDAWREALRVRVKLLAVTARAMYERLAEPGTFLVSGTRMGGFLGMDDDGALSAIPGAVVGFTKALHREREHATVKVVDADGDASAAQVAEALIEETLRDPGSVEVGHHGGLRWAVGLDERPLGEPADGLPLGPGSVFVVTGAAGSIVSEIVTDLARATGGSFHLLDLAAEPNPDDPDLAAFGEGREVAKRVLMERAKAAGERPTPVLIERQLGGLERGYAALSAMRAVREAGGDATYHRVDLTDPEAVGAAVAKIRAEHDRVDVVLHAAGLEISRFLPDKEQREFDLVFDVKSNGWANLLHALDGVPIGAVVAFCSVAGRFGNGGQTDYSAANGLLGAGISNLRRTRPGTRGIAIDWSAWAGIGMATRGSIPKMMEAAGIDMLPPEVGVPYIRRELVGSAFRGELVVGGRLGLMLQEWAERGGIDPEAFAGESGPVAGTVTTMGIYEGLRVQVELHPSRQPFLEDHRIDGTPVMPGVMGIETFAEVASRALPGWHVVAVEDVAFRAPLKCYRDEARTVTVEATFHPRGAEVVADCRLIGFRPLPGRDEPQATVHFSARVVLAAEPAAPERAEVPEPSGGAAGRDAIYDVYFHGPAYQVLDRAWPEDPAIGLLREGLPPNHAPEGAPLVASPRLIELCFQTAGMWEICARERFGLPAEVGRVRIVGDAAGAVEPICAVVRPAGDAFDAEVVDAVGAVIVALEGYRTVELPGALDPAAIEALRSGLV
ncbi:MAG TPA: SDR family NAD(P)-dependent oxidoreductase, partial [Actinomycetota bacterium]|nr:SDR family NAD(P)-dependent oxidoreductase [Actinomycetota bacterium]